MNLRDYARRLRRGAVRGAASLASAKHSSTSYSRRVDAEQQFFGGCQTAYELPDIYGYWSNKYLRPKLERFGFSTPEAMYSDYFEQSYASSASAQRTFLSIGAGACETEIRLARGLVDRGHPDFVIECVEFNEDLLKRGAVLAKEQGVSGHIVSVRADFNTWSPTKPYDAVLANNSLHHVLNLEGLLDNIRTSLAPTGFFVTCDMIGRNGHMRWPEALSIVHEYWDELPKQYTYNHLLRRYEAEYENWDCSIDGFEGIRAQEILPLLIARFEFDWFVPFANVVDPFIERTFGPNFKASNTWDTSFIDRVHARDDAEIMRGAIKPCHILAAMCTGRAGRNLTIDGLTRYFAFVRPSALRSRRGGSPRRRLPLVNPRVTR